MQQRESLKSHMSVHPHHIRERRSPGKTQRERADCLIVISKSTDLGCMVYHSTELPIVPVPPREGLVTSLYIPRRLQLKPCLAGEAKLGEALGEAKRVLFLSRTHPLTSSKAGLTSPTPLYISAFVILDSTARCTRHSQALSP